MATGPNESFRSVLVAKLDEALDVRPPPSTERRLHGALSLPGKATAAIGVRRAGKTTLLHQVRSKRHDEGVARERLPYVNFEDERIVGVTAAELHFLIEEYYRRYPRLRGTETVTWCFDEIQVVAGWERFVRRLLDTEKIDVFLSGSSAALLSREIATAMRGRAWEVVILPFGFDEFLRHHQLEVPTAPDRLRVAQRSALEHAFLDFLVVGGFPEAQRLDTASRARLLTDYVDVAVLRDVVERHRVTNIVGLRWLVRHLLANAGGLFSVEKFFRALKSQGVAISKGTLHELLAQLEDCFLVRTLWMEATSERQRMVHPRRAYPIDPGLISVFDRQRRANQGHALETAVFIELERRRMAVTYVGTESGFEVDFLARGPDGTEELIQVCADASDPGVADRELRALEEAGKAHPRATRRLLTATRDALPRTVPKKVVAQAAYEWMLADPSTR